MVFPLSAFLCGCDPEQHSPTILCLPLIIIGFYLIFFLSLPLSSSILGFYNEIMPIISLLDGLLRRLLLRSGRILPSQRPLVAEGHAN